MDEKFAPRIAVVTDSTADLPRTLVDMYHIHIIPQTLIMGKQTWQDGVEIDPPTFYELLKTSPHFPTTSQPSTTQFETLFRDLARTADGIVAVLVSDELSGTLNSARSAAANLPDIPIEIVDSRAASMQLGFTALAAARAAAQGADLQAVADAARDLVGRVYIYFVVDTLEYLHRGGRIGAAAKLFGSALNLKPVLEIRDGIVTPLTRVRTQPKALAKVQELFLEKVAENDRVHTAVINAATPEAAASFKASLLTRCQPVEVVDAECGPVIGTHAGPGTIGLAFYVE